MNLRDRLLELGYNRDLEISREEWMKVNQEEEHKGSRSLAVIEHRDEPTYRDNRKTESVELKDYINQKYEADFIAELEHYNPDKAPLRHVLIEFPTRLWKNRIKNRGPKQK